MNIAGKVNEPCRQTVCKLHNYVIIAQKLYEHCMNTAWTFHEKQMNLAQKVCAHCTTMW